MASLKISFNGSSNIGLYAFVNDKFMLLGKEIPESQDKDLYDHFKVPIHRITIAGTSLVGVFVAGNNNKILVPSIIFDDERRALEKLGINFEIFDTRLTCLGNNIAATEDRAIINQEFSDAQLKEIEKKLEVKATKAKIAETLTMGSIITINPEPKKALISSEVTEQELEFIQRNLGVECTTGTVNMGTSQVKSGILCNKHGIALGKASGFPEVRNADEALGFI